MMSQKAPGRRRTSPMLACGLLRTARQLQCKDPAALQWKQPEPFPKLCAFGEDWTGVAHIRHGATPQQCRSTAAALPSHQNRAQSYRHAECHESPESCIQLHVQQCCGVYSPHRYTIASGNCESLQRYLEEPCYAWPHRRDIRIQGVVPQQHPHRAHDRGKADDVGDEQPEARAAEDALIKGIILFQLISAAISSLKTLMPQVLRSTARAADKRTCPGQLECKPSALFLLISAPGGRLKA